MDEAGVPGVSIALGACTVQDAGITEPDPQACGADTPTITWETFGEGFLSTYCQGCHASGTPNRQGAPENILFDTEDDALAFGGLILNTAASDEPRMPPNGGPLQEDRDRLYIWLTCFAD